MHWAEALTAQDPKRHAPNGSVLKDVADTAHKWIHAPVRAAPKALSSNESKFVGKWVRFVGCGTNGGIKTIAELRNDRSGTLEKVTVKGAVSTSTRARGEQESDVLWQGSWKIT